MAAPRIDKVEANALIALSTAPQITTMVDVAKISAPFTTVVNRALIPDLANDCSVRMGIERVMTQSIQEIQNEFGPAGERVFGALNDDRGLVRFVGAWSSNTSNEGAHALGLPNDFCEVTFYGTGLNALLANGNSTRSAVVSVDGGADGANIIPASLSGVLDGRGYSVNQLVSLASGLSLGIHTVRLKCTAINMRLEGFEVLNTSSTLVIQPGTALGNSTKATLLSQALVSHNTGFESGSLSTRGGHVLVYLKSDGTIGKAVQPTNASQLNLTSADHTNEEMIRTYHWREFGAGRSDDFSFLSGASQSARAFTLDDGTTTLTSSNPGVYSGDSLSLFENISTFGSFTFIGTGLDLSLGAGASTPGDTIQVFVDGANVGNLTTLTNKQHKIVSGLPYGTHTVKFNRTVASTGTVTIKQFIVYGPKKPALPTGAVELADYNVMADYTASTSAAVGFVAPGTLRKMGTRENLYVGTWYPSLDVANQIFESGFNIQTSTAGSFFTYTFFGTGLEYSTFVQNAQARNHTISIDGSTNLSTSNSSWPGIVTGLIGSNLGTITLTNTTGLLAGTSAAAIGGRLRLRISGLPLGLHTIKVLWNSGVDQIYADALDIITPIHSHKSNIYADLQNTLAVGSQGIQDSKSYKGVALASSGKAWAQAVGVVSGPTTTSTTLIPMPDMSLTIKTSGGPLQISYSVDVSNSNVNNTTTVQLFVNGVAVGTAKVVQNTVPNQHFLGSDTIIVPVAAGTHKVDVYWSTNANTSQALGVLRNMYAREL